MIAVSTWASAPGDHELGCSALDGRRLAFHLTEGQASNSPPFEILLDLGPDITPRAAVGTKDTTARVTGWRRGTVASAR